MFNKINTGILKLIKNVCILLYIIDYINITPLYGCSTDKNEIRKSEYGKNTMGKTFYIKSLLKKNKWSENKKIWTKEIISKFALNTRKRYKEALAIRKYRMTGTSTVARHYGLEGRGGGRKKINKVTMLPRKEIILPARRCMVLGKMDNRNARKISKSGIKTHRIQRLNLLRKRIYFEKEDRFVKLRVSTQGLKTIKKFGLEYCCKKFKLNLKKKKVDAGRSMRKKNKKEKLSEHQKELLQEKSMENYEDVKKIMQSLNIQKGSK